MPEVNLEGFINRVNDELARRDQQYITLKQEIADLRDLVDMLVRSLEGRIANQGKEIGDLNRRVTVVEQRR